jgi:hypothetical protein
VVDGAADVEGAVEDPRASIHMHRRGREGHL